MAGEAELWVLDGLHPMPWDKQRVTWKRVICVADIFDTAGCR